MREDDAGRGDNGDAELREIIEQGEAGIGDFLAVYEEAERHYVAAASAAEPPAPGVSYAADTSR